MATPLLITPDGKKIELSPETYKQIQKILREQKNRAQRLARIDSLHGKYAAKTSLTQALLKERREELAREEAKLKRRKG
jgi:hypothetical protein